MKILEKRECSLVVEFDKNDAALIIYPDESGKNINHLITRGTEDGSYEQDNPSMYCRAMQYFADDEEFVNNIIERFNKESVRITIINN